jgi:hypothetical protein
LQAYTPRLFEGSVLINRSCRSVTRRMVISYEISRNWCQPNLEDFPLKTVLITLAIAVTGCASQPSSSPSTPLPSGVRPVGQSMLAPRAAATCIAQKWANSSQQTVYMQHVFANDTAFDVYVPGQQIPGGSAALVRPAPSGSGSAVFFRGAETADSGAIGQCQS